MCRSNRCELELGEHLWVSVHLIHELLEVEWAICQHFVRVVVFTCQYVAIVLLLELLHHAVVDVTGMLRRSPACYRFKR